METGARGVQPRDVRDLANLYGLADGDREELMALARVAKERAWYDEYDVPDSYKEYYGLEGTASDICWLEVTRIPGLLQTKRYTRALLQAISTLHSEDAHMIDAIVSIREKRQERLTDRTPPRLTVIMGEMSLWRSIGTAVVMREQIDHVLEVSTWTSIDVRILEHQAGFTLAEDGPFIILEGEGGAFPVVFREQGTLFLRDTADIAKYQAAFHEVLGHASSPLRSRDILHQARTHWDVIDREQNPSGA
jgi:hypothetical protein